MLCIVLCARLPGVTAAFMHNKSMSVLIFIKYDCSFFLLRVFICSYAVSVPFSLQIIRLQVQSNLLLIGFCVTS